MSALLKKCENRECKLAIPYVATIQLILLIFAGFDLVEARLDLPMNAEKL